MKHRNPLLIATLCCAAVLAACKAENPAAQSAQNSPAPAKQSVPAEQPASAANADADVVATVNGKAITRAEYDSYARERTMHRPPSSKDPEEERKAVINELINLELIRQDAVNKGLDKKPEVVADLENQRRSILVGTAVRQQVENNPISDEALKKEYDARIASQSTTEYKARHILLSSEEDAKGIIAQLDKGADFQKLANEHSSDPAAKNGGDLGWFTADQMVQPFAEAVKTMKKGAYTKAPVKTEFGWHVILLEDTRQNPPPSFEQVKEQVRNFMQSQQINDYISKLREQGKIEIR